MQLWSKKIREKCPYSEFFYSVSLRIQSKCGKIRTRKTPNTDTFRAVIKFSNMICLSKVLFFAVSGFIILPNITLAKDGDIFLFVRSKRRLGKTQGRQCITDLNK